MLNICTLFAYNIHCSRTIYTLNVGKFVYLIKKTVVGSKLTSNFLGIIIYLYIYIGVYHEKENTLNPIKFFTVPRVNYNS